MESLEETIWDVAVIGGGPAGMMTAGRAAERGLKVVLIEKNDTLGKKLLITGGGRCNVTNAEFDDRALLQKFKDDGKYLFSTFSKWSVKETLDFFYSYNMETKVENEKRVFPVSNKAQSVWNVLVEYMKKGGVTILSNSPVVEVLYKDRHCTGVKIKGGKLIKAKNFVLATGGKSRPETGSTGEGFDWLKKLGHTIIEPSASLVPVSLNDEWTKKLSGLALQNIKLTLFQNGEKQDSKLGKILFTHVGISGPTVLNMSKDIGELLKYGEVVISLDLIPSRDYGELNTALQELFKTENLKKLKNTLGLMIPPAIVPIVITMSDIDPDRFNHSVTREERVKLVKIMKNIPMNVKGLLGVEKAIVTSGGVKLDEIDFKTMQSRLFPNLYLVGDVLNIDRPSGGYSLQLCWTTGFVAGDSVER
jgi:hypothetical protein